LVRKIQTEGGPYYRKNNKPKGCHEKSFFPEKRKQMTVGNRKIYMWTAVDLHEHPFWYRGAREATDDFSVVFIYTFDTEDVLRLLLTNHTKDDTSKIQCRTMRLNDAVQSKTIPVPRKSLSVLTKDWSKVLIDLHDDGRAPPSRVALSRTTRGSLAKTAHGVPSDGHSETDSEATSSDVSSDVEVTAVTIIVGDCMKCKENGDEAKLLMCDGVLPGVLSGSLDECPNMCHTACCSPPLRSLPKGPWYCGQPCNRRSMSRLLGEQGERGERGERGEKGKKGKKGRGKKGDKGGKGDTWPS